MLVVGIIGIVVVVVVVLVLVDRCSLPRIDTEVKELVESS